MQASVGDFFFFVVVAEIHSKICERVSNPEVNWEVDWERGLFALLFQFGLFWRPGFQIIFVYFWVRS